VPNYTLTSRAERANPPAEAELPAMTPPARGGGPGAAGGAPAAPQPVKISPEFAKQIAGRWVGRPQLAVMDYDIEIEFTPQPDGTLMGRLIQTTLPDPREPKPINKAFRNFNLTDRRLSWTFPNTQEWSFNGELSADGTAIAGATNSAQGGILLTFRKK
jgi:hypothetical protein